MLKSDLRVGQISRPLASNCEDRVRSAQLVATQLARIDGGFRNSGSIVETSVVLLDQGVIQRRGRIGLSHHRHVQQPQSKQSPAQMSHTNTPRDELVLQPLKIQQLCLAIRYLEADAYRDQSLLFHGKSSDTPGHGTTR